MTKILNPVLASANDQAVYFQNNCLMKLDEAFETGQVVLEGVAGASHLKWSHDGVYASFIIDGKLKVVTVSTGQVVEAPLEHVSQYEWGAGTTLYVTAQDGALVKWMLQGDVQLLIENAFIEAYSVAREIALIKRNRKLFALSLGVGELQEVTVEAGQYGQAAFSFTGQYVAYIGETATERHVYVYDFDLGITQNLTEMLDVYAGDAMSPFSSCEQKGKEIQWTETDALYFTLSSDGDVRLYYADLYGSLFPASPESEHIISFTVASSGNWALYVADAPFVETRFRWFDITSGEGRTIVEHNVLVLENVEIYYEMVEVAGQTLYMWGYVPVQSASVYVVLSGRGRMLGNSYESRLESAMNEQKAVVYMNHPGAFGYGEDYAKTELQLNETTLKNVVVEWLEQKGGCSLTIEVIVN